MAAADLTAARVRELLHYNPDNGLFTWRVDRPRRKAGSVAGCFDKALGYWRICINDRVLYAHRLAWLWVTGDHPNHQIDHINGVRYDNRWTNLRDACAVVNNNTRAAPACVPWKRQIRTTKNGVTTYGGYTSDPLRQAKF
jgi:hypothetical protein